MEKILDAALGLIETIFVVGVIGFSGVKCFENMHHFAHAQTLKVLKTPSPSMSQFSRKLTKNK